MVWLKYTGKMDCGTAVFAADPPAPRSRERTGDGPVEDDPEPETGRVRRADRIDIP